MNNILLSFIHKTKDGHDLAFAYHDSREFNLKKFIIEICTDKYTNSTRHKSEDVKAFDYYIIHPHILSFNYSTNKLTTLPISDKKSLIVYNLFCDIKLYSKITNLVTTNEIAYKILRICKEKTKYGFNIIGPHNINNALFWDKWASLRNIYIKYCKNIKKEVISKWLRMEAKWDINEYKFKTREILIVQKAVRSFLIKRKLWREIGVNKALLIDRMHRNMRENGFETKYGKIFFEQHEIDNKEKDTAIWMSHVNEPILADFIEEMREKIKNNSKIDIHRPGVYRVAMIKVSQLLKMNPESLTGTFYFIIYKGRTIFFKKRKETLNQYDIDYEIILERTKMGEYFVEESNKLGVHKRTKFPMTFKGGLFSSMADGYRNNRFKDVSALNQTPFWILVKLFWLKHYPGVRLFKCAVWNLRNFKPYKWINGEKILYESLNLYRHFI